MKKFCEWKIKLDSQIVKMPEGTEFLHVRPLSDENELLGLATLCDFDEERVIHVMIDVLSTGDSMSDKWYADRRYVGSAYLCRRLWHVLVKDGANA